MNPTNQIFTATMVLLGALSGCSTAPPYNAMLEQASNEYRMAQGSSRVSELAPAEMAQATAALSLANEASMRSAPSEEVTHLAYLAKQRVAIAREVASQKQDEENVANARSARESMRLTARTNEADEAQRRAAAAQQQAAVSDQQAIASQNMASETQARNAALEAQLRDLNAKQTSRGIVITIADVLFDTNQAVLKAGGWREIDKLVNFLNQYPQRRVLIEGFTDSVGGAELNQVLSSRRADAVRARLVEMGIAPSRVQTRGYGEADPIASNATAEGRQLNRRVEIVLSDDNGNITPR
ncbi:OmpA family protein [Aquabacterium sp.]|uniref:OmpA family protein n=1 Tax=Aquabacterium sp. TaxID=1872578 RepID=UPI002E2FB5EA|nr:OmpA family protein [Aquabacterium sp.]HEX5311971.1 OmpA family protein [Aquabacterium sp.]